ncbi:MAG: response regulator [Haloarculaceae archaeon]
MQVDDDPEFAALSAEMLDREDDRITVETVHSAPDGLDRLRESEVDCVVSDYDMPGRNGIEFLDAVRAEFSDLPFILFTGKGSEAVASDAISAGVTDYLQKGSGSERYELLANRVVTAVRQYRTEEALARQSDLFEKAQDIADVGAWEYDIATGTSYLSDETMRIHGLPPDEDLSPEESFGYYHPEDRPAIREAFTRAVEEGVSYDMTVRLVTEDGTRRWVRTRGEPQSTDGEVVRVRGTLQDITVQKRREQSLQRQNDRLEEFASVVSHDIRTPLQVAMGNLNVAERTGREAAFAKVRQALGRIETIVEDVLTLAREGQAVRDTERVSLDGIAREAWEAAGSSDVELRTIGGYSVQADPDRLRRLFENLFRNAIEHAGSDITVSVGPIEPMPTATRDASDRQTGFYVEDDGRGIPDDERGDVFDAGYSNSDAGTGFGLSIVERVAEAHDWEILVTESADGGARFEVTGLDLSV